MAWQVILVPAILGGQFREFDSPRVHTRINSYGLFLVHKVGRSGWRWRRWARARHANGEMGVPAEVSSVQSVRGCGAVDGDRAIFRHALS